MCFYQIIESFRHDNVQYLIHCVQESCGSVCFRDGIVLLSDFVQYNCEGLTEMSLAVFGGTGRRFWFGVG